MSKTLKKLNVLGDSYTTPGFYVEPQDSFWGKMARDLAVDTVENYSHPGFSFDHVMHVLLSEQFDFENEYFLLGIPPLARFVIYSDVDGQTWNSWISDANFNSVKRTVRSLTNTNLMRAEDLHRDVEQLTKFSVEWHDVQSLEKIYLIHQYLWHKQAKFMIVNLSKPMVYQESWPAGMSIMNKTKQLAECIIFDNTYYSVNREDNIKPMDYDQYQWSGHHGSAGNANWYNKVIKPKMIELNWIANA